MSLDLYVFGRCGEGRLIDLDVFLELFRLLGRFAGLHVRRVRHHGVYRLQDFDTWQLVRILRLHGFVVGRRLDVRQVDVGGVR